MSSDHKKGKEELSQAKKYEKSSVFSFRFSPEYESVLRHARRAVDAFKMAGAAAYDELIESYLLGIEAAKQTNTLPLAAKFSDELGDLFVKIGDEIKDKDEKLALENYEKSITQFQNCAKFLFYTGDQGDRTVNAALKATQSMFELKQYQQGYDYILETCTKTYQGESRLIGAEKNLQTAIHLFIQVPNWDMVLNWLRFQTSIYSNRRDMYNNNIFHNYLSEIVIHLFLHKFDESDKILQKYNQTDDAFLKSEQYCAAKALISACNSSNTDALIKARKDWPILKYMERDIALLVPKLVLNPQYCGIEDDDGDDGDDGDDDQKGGKKESKKDQKVFMDASDDIASQNL